MTLKTSKAAPHHTGTALGIAKLGSSCGSENSATAHFSQEHIAVRWLARRCGLTMAAAAAVASANAFGGRA